MTTVDIGSPRYRVMWREYHSRGHDLEISKNPRTVTTPQSVDEYGFVIDFEFEGGCVFPTREMAQAYIDAVKNDTRVSLPLYG